MFEAFLNRAGMGGRRLYDRYGLMAVSIRIAWKTVLQSSVRKKKRKAITQL